MYLALVVMWSFAFIVLRNLRSAFIYHFYLLTHWKMNTTMICHRSRTRPPSFIYFVFPTNSKLLVHNNILMPNTHGIDLFWMKSFVKKREMYFMTSTEKTTIATAAAVVIVYKRDRTMKNPTKLSKLGNQTESINTELNLFPRSWFFISFKLTHLYSEVRN